MKLVFLTGKCSRAAEILNHMKGRGIAVEAILIERPKPSEIAGFLIKRAGFVRTMRIAFGLLGSLMPWTTDSWVRTSSYYSYSGRVYMVDDLNGEECERILTQLKPEVVALGCSPVLRENIIGIPRIGILNAHPGLLPEYRGMDTIEWAIYNGDEVAVAVHFVDRGVDTGPVIRQRVIDLEPNDTMENLRKKADAAAAELLSDTILRVFQGERISGTPQSVQAGKRYYRMPRKLRRETKRRLKARFTEPATS